MLNKHSDDLDRLRQYFQEKHSKPGSEQSAIFEKYYKQMVAENSKKVMEDIRKAEKNPFKTNTKAIAEGLNTMYGEVGYGMQMSEEQRKFGARFEAEAMKDGIILPAISSKNRLIDQLGERVDKLKKDYGNLNKQYTGIKEKFKQLQNKFTNLVSNLIHKEGFSQSKVDNYTKASVKETTQQKTLGKSR